MLGPFDMPAGIKKRYLEQATRAGRHIALPLGAPCSLPVDIGHFDVPAGIGSLLWVLFFRAGRYISFALSACSIGLAGTVSLGCFMLAGTPPLPGAIYIWLTAL
ncbi:uncharacterized protein P884DRAFT_265481 [Thermothelomyces heterothallicus CBS 202.75]|uniref:uncharacterized protein n=1 Tax=Thermothelomyces heterothallicus CBS 202.75 TaxID=1149848 RepID=UPI0037437E85